MSERLIQLLKKMDLPAHRIDKMTLGNLKWLLRNMGIRNSGCEGYHEARNLIVDTIKDMNGCSKKEAASIH